MKYRLWIVLALISLLGLAGCEKSIKGNGVKQSQIRPLATFNSITLSGNYQLNIIGGKAQQVTIVSDSNLIPYINTQVNGETLTITTNKGYKLVTSSPPEIDITLPTLKKLTLNGNGKVLADEIQGEKFELRSDGAVQADLNGAVTNATFTVNGVGQIMANQLIAQNTQITLSGSGVIQAYASKKLKVRVSGNGKVQYFGEPRQIDQKINGNGEVLGVANNESQNPIKNP